MRTCSWCRKRFKVTPFRKDFFGYWYQSHIRYTGLHFHRQTVNLLPKPPYKKENGAIVGLAYCSFECRNEILKKLDRYHVSDMFNRDVNSFRYFFEKQDEYLKNDYPAEYLAELLAKKKKREVT